MSVLVLKTYTGHRLLETYGKKNTSAIARMLCQPEFQSPVKEDGWGRPMPYADKFELFTLKQARVFSGDITQCIEFLRKYR